MARVGNVSIIVVDDHRGFRESLVSFLAQIPGVEVLGQAADGLEAEQMLSGLSPDLVIMDVKMPRLNGIEAARRIKNQRPSVRVVLYSMDEPAVNDWAELKVDGFIPKQQLFEQILSAIQSR